MGNFASVLRVSDVLVLLGASLFLSKGFERKCAHISKPTASVAPTRSLAHLPAVHEIRVPSSVFARLAPHTGAEARERPSEHQTSV